MIKDIVLGNRRNNILSYIQKSRLAKATVIGNCVCVYYLFFSQSKLEIRNMITIGIIGLLLFNLYCIPVRVMTHKKIGIWSKIVFLILCVAVCMLIVDIRYKTGLFMGQNIDMIEISSAFTFFFLLFTSWLKWKSHQNEKWHLKKYKDINEMEGHDFEYYCADILQKKGFSHIEVTPGSGDYGIDIIAYKDGLKYGIQCKRYSSTVGWHAVEEAMTGSKYYGCDIAVVMTNSVFSKQAIEGAERVGVRLWGKIGVK